MGERTFVDRNVWSVWEAPSRIEMDKRSGDDLQQMPPAHGITFELRRDNRVPDYSREYTLLIAKRPYGHSALRSPTLSAHPVCCILVGGFPAAVNRSRPTT